jgi:predicted metal-dependent hydrolase
MSLRRAGVRGTLALRISLYTLGMKTKITAPAGSVENLKVDHLEVQVHWSSRRKTVAVTVSRQGQVLIAAPDTSGTEALAAFIRDKRYWIYTKLARREILGPNRGHPSFVDGDTFPYLGRRHELKIVSNDAQDIPLKLNHGRFHLRHKDSVAGRGHFLRWYRRHAKPFLEDRADAWTHELDVQPASITVRDLGTRWSAFAPDGTVQFHWASILIPPEYIDYLLLRTLTHLHERNFTSEYWSTVEKAMPDFPERSLWLIRNGNNYAWL